MLTQRKSMEERYAANLKASIAAKNISSRRQGQIKLDEGKYVIHYDRETGKQWATRYGEYWRDLTGDKLILALIERGDTAYAAGMAAGEAKERERCVKICRDVEAESFGDNAIDFETLECLVRIEALKEQK